MYGGSHVSLVTAIFCLWYLANVKADLERTCYGPPTGFSVCGSDLSDLIENVCSNPFFMSYRKRDTSGLGVRSRYDYQNLSREGPQDSGSFNELDMKRLDRIKMKNIAAKNANKDSTMDRLKGLILSKRDALSRHTRSSTIPTKGIVCECCHNQCSFYEIIQYCE